MDIAVEEFSHLEIVGATIQMLPKGVNGELNAADESEIIQVTDGKETRKNIIHQALTANPQLVTVSCGGPRPTNSQDIPWCGSYIHLNGDLTVDLRSNLGSESRAKLGKKWECIEDPIAQVNATEGLTVLKDEKEAELKKTAQMDAKMSETESKEVFKAEPGGVAQWSTCKDSKPTK